MSVIYIGSDGYVQLSEFEDILTGARITNATVTATLYDDKTNTQLGPVITMPHVESGLYRGAIPYNLSGIADGMRIRVEVFADGGSGKRMTKKLFTSAKVDK